MNVNGIATKPDKQRSVRGLMLGIAGAPVYLAGILAGRALFPLASPATYRRLAFAVILFAVITALPLWNG